MLGDRNIPKYVILMYLTQIGLTTEVQLQNSNLSVIEL